MVHSFPTVRLKRVISILYILFYMRAGGTSRGLPRNGIGAGRLQGGCRYILARNIRRHEAARTTSSA